MKQINIVRSPQEEIPRRETMTEEEILQAFKIPEGIDMAYSQQFHSYTLSKYSVLSVDDPLRTQVQGLIFSFFLRKQKRSKTKL